MKTRIYATLAVKGLSLSIWLFPSLFYLTFKQENLKDKFIFKLHYILNSKDQGFEQTAVEPSEEGARENVPSLHRDVTPDSPGQA